MPRPGERTRRKTEPIRQAVPDRVSWTRAVAARIVRSVPLSGPFNLVGVDLYPEVTVRSRAPPKAQRRCEDHMRAALFQGGHPGLRGRRPCPHPPSPADQPKKLALAAVSGRSNVVPSIATAATGGRTSRRSPLKPSAGTPRRTTPAAARAQPAPRPRDRRPGRHRAVPLHLSAYASPSVSSRDRGAAAWRYPRGAEQPGRSAPDRERSLEHSGREVGKVLR
jgi:hypothetical protein